MKAILFIIKLPLRLIALLFALMLAVVNVIAVMLINVESFVMDRSCSSFSDAAFILYLNMIGIRH